MSEFDFDELDRAVNNALTGDQPAASDAQGSARPLDPVAPQAAPAAPVSQTPTPSLQPERSAAPNPAARRAAPSGRFMDMVHPSSDMRSSTSGSVASTPSQAQRPAQSQPQVKPAAAPEPSAPSWASDHHVPTGPASIPDAAPAPKQSAEPDLGFIEEDEPRALESPFLPDAKVEKRPLGGLASTEGLQFEETPSLSKSIEEALSEVALVEAEDATPQLAAPNWSANVAFRTEPTEKLLEAPEEEPLLEEPEHQELLTEGAAPQAGLSAALEYPQESTLGDIPNPHAEDAAPLEDTNEAIDVVPAPVAEPPKSAPVNTPEVSLPTGPSSISQQYTEKPSTTAEPGAIFDTESYHQPITAKVKKRSGAWTVLWIVLLVLAGAGAGAAFYLFVLPML